MTDHPDPLLDACLDELLGGQTPPDLTDRILRAAAVLPPRVDSFPPMTSGSTLLVTLPPQRLANESATSAAATAKPPQQPDSSVGNLPDAASPSPVTARSASLTPPPVLASTRSGATAKHRTYVTPQSSRPRIAANPSNPTARPKPNRLRRSILPMSVLALLVLIGCLIFWQDQGHLPSGSKPRLDIAQSSASDPSTRTGSSFEEFSAAKTGNAPEQTVDKTSSVIEAPASRLPHADRFADWVGLDSQPSGAAQANSNGTQPATTVPAERKTDDLPKVAMPPRHPVTDAEVVSQIDDYLNRAWKDAKLQPASAATDQELAERLFQRLLGRSPTVDELRRYLQDGTRDKRARWAKLLSEDESYVEEFARHWGRHWTETLVGSRSGPLPNGARRDGLEQFLRRALVRNQPFHEVAYELLTATGSGVPGTPQYNGAANFLIAHWDRSARQATAQTARLFLGQEQACAACHQHPTDQQLTQSHFWELNSFLRQLVVERGAAGEPILVNRDFFGDGGSDHAAAEVFYETSAGELKVAYPALPEYRQLPRSGVVAEFDRRTFLAEYLTRSEPFRQATVNRVWTAVFGYGLRPALHAQQEVPGHQLLLDKLADSFAASQHDLRALIRWLVLSQPFGLSDMSPVGIQADSPEWGARPSFSRFYALPAEKANPIDRIRQVVAVSATPNVGGLPLGPTAARLDPLSTAPRLPAPELNSALSTVHGLPNFRFQKFLAGTAIEAILQSDKLNQEQKLDHLFLATVQRLPSQQELAILEPLFKDEANSRTALTHVWWALAYSSEAQSLR